ncbi:hypothetical protein HPB52_016560 [Rhipicephalus sanguineus]|uniref:Uncharacterized protein n=1 Tax=Rhipicephalus sanguineus TaxID=34632 RepID=A0A9D4TAV9_RHISA|nr:hypothetical protein HPB52_016560 [Rhipicephalus sanguineus]
MSSRNEHKTRPAIGAGEKSVAAGAHRGPSIHRARGPFGITADAGGLSVDLLRSCEEGCSCWRPHGLISANVISRKKLDPIQNTSRGRKPRVGSRISTVD